MRTQQRTTPSRTNGDLLATYALMAAMYVLISAWMLYDIVTAPFRANTYLIVDIMLLLSIGGVLVFLMKRTHARVTREQHLLDVLTAHATDMVMAYTPDRQLTYVSPSCEALTGYSEAEFIDAAWSRLLSSADLAVMQSRLDAAFLKGRCSYGEMQFIKRNGDIKWMQVTIEILRADAATVSYIQVRLHDVTERKLLEERLEQTESLFIKNDKLALLGQLVAGVMHELNNPLASILGYTQLLLQSNLSPQTRTDLSLIETQARRSSKIVTNLLRFARQHEPTRLATDINTLIERTVELRAYFFQTHNMSIDLWLAPNLPMTSADPYQLQQVLLNLIINAEHALIDQAEGETSGKLLRLAIETTYEQRGEPNEGVITIRVSDTGPGIAPEIVDRIFEPFFTTKPEGIGTGLGLMIARDIVTEHGGMLTIDSQVGQGTAVTIRLPEVHTVMSTVVPREKPVIPAAARILIADDEEAIRDVLARVLGQWGAHVDHVSTGAMALERIQSSQYDVIICDLHMRGLSGQDVYTALVSTVPQVAHTLLFMSGDSVNDEMMSWIEETGCPLLMKPFDIETLLNAVVALLPIAVRSTNPLYALPRQSYKPALGNLTRAA